MSTIAKLMVSLGLSSKDFGIGLTDAEKRSSSAGDKIGKALMGAGKLAVVGLAAAATGVVALAAATVPAASNLNETVSKIGVVFGDSADKVLEFGNTSASALGMSTNAALTAVGTYGNLFRSMGMTDTASADMSTNLVKLASDLASFNNMANTDVLEKLRAGLTGETEPLKSLGINLNQATVQAKALEMGLVTFTPTLSAVTSASNKLSSAQDNLYTTLSSVQPINDQQGKALKAMRDAYWEVSKSVYEAGKGSPEHLESLGALQSTYDQYKDLLGNGVVQAMGYVTTETGNLSSALVGNAGELSASVKAQATYALVMEQTALAQGDFARTSGGLANQQRIMAANVENLKAKFGQALLPVVEKGVTLFNNLATQALPLVEQGVKTLGGWIESTLIPALSNAWNYFSANIVPILAVVWGWLQVNLPIALQTLSNFWNGTLLPALTTAWSYFSANIVPVLVDVWNWLSVNLPPAIQTLSDFWSGTLLPALTAIWDHFNTKIIPIFSDVCNWLSANLPPAIQTLSDYWNTTLLPALTAVWNFLQTSVLPLFQALDALLSATLGVTLTALAGLWQNVLLPALTEVWSYISTTLGPVFEDLQTWLADVTGGFDGIAKAVDKVIGWINDLTEKLKGLKLPKALTPGSPTPFETGLWGIASALDQLNRNELPEFAMRVKSPALAGANAGQAANQRVQNYYLTGNYQYQSEQTLSGELRKLRLMRG